MKPVTQRQGSHPTETDRLDRELSALPRPLWDQVFRDCADRIRSLGKISGSIECGDAAVVRAVEGMGCPVRAGRVSLAKLDRAMRSGRLPQGLLAATERWIGASIITKREERGQQQQQWAQLLAGWRVAIAEPLDGMPDATEITSRLNEWLTSAAPWIKGRWRKRPSTIDRSVRWAIAAARRAPGIGVTARAVPLPVFAQQLVGNPHALDAGRTAGRLALGAMRSRFREHVGEVSGFGAEARAAILDAAGLSTDGVSSRVVVFGLAGSHPLFAAAASMSEPLTLTALNLEHMDVVTAAGGVVFVVENPAVFTSLVRAITTSRTSNARSAIASIVCTSGQFGVTAAQLLDRLSQTGATIFYSGDFDPPGLYIADRVFRRYPGRVVLWRMTHADYQFARWHHHGIPTASATATSPVPTGWPSTREYLLDVIKQTGPAFQEALVEELARDVGRLLAASTGCGP